MPADFHSLDLVTPPAATPISVSDAKLHLRVDHTDDDAKIGLLIDAAVSYVDALGYLGKAMITQSWVQSVGASPGVVCLPLGPVQTLTSVSYYDPAGDLIVDTLSNYDLRTSRFEATVRPKDAFSWPETQSRDDAILIEYVAGYGNAGTDVPASINQALFMLVSHWYENRETVLNGGMATEIPYGLEAILRSHRKIWIG